jgi:hypothetical protein
VSAQIVEIGILYEFGIVVSPSRDRTVGFVKGLGQGGGKVTVRRAYMRFSIRSLLLSFCVVVVVVGGGVSLLGRERYRYCRTARKEERGKRRTGIHNHHLVHEVDSLDLDGW